MTKKFQPLSDSKIKQLSVVSFGLAFLLVATLAGGAVIGLKTANRLEAIQSDWLDFRHITANKGQSLSQVRNYFGFGGFIHNFQNYVSKRDPELEGLVRRDIDELLAAISTYEIVGVSPAERTALTDIRNVIARYQENLEKVKKLIQDGASTAEMARLTEVDNRPAFAALSTLEVIWLEELDSQTKQLMTDVAKGEGLITMTIVFIPILGLTLVALLWFMQRLLQVTMGTVKVDKELRISEEKNRLFAADVAHELRMPLAVMRLHLEKLEDRETAAAMMEYVENMARMLEQLLAAAKMESQAEQNTEQVNLHDICVKVGAEMGPMAVRDGRSIEVQGSLKPTIINANSFALELAVRNLVENSIKYSARRTKIIIEVTDEPAIKVTDKGPGIPTEMRETIFDPFLRSDRRSNGSGLGLSIVRRAAEVHGATIKIDDNPGGGSVFTISFPPESLKAAT